MFHCEHLLIDCKSVSGVFFLIIIMPLLGKKKLLYFSFQEFIRDSPLSCEARSLPFPPIAPHSQ